MKTGYKQIGSTGLSRYGGYVYEEFLPNLRWPGAGRVYKEMADNDPVIGAILYLAEMLIRNAEWSVEPASDSPEDVAAAEFVQSCLDDMDTSWSDTISEILSMLTYGFSFHELVYKIRRGPEEKNSRYRSKYTDGKIGWRRLPIRSQETLHEWVFDKEGDIKAFVQRTDSGYVTIPLSKGLLFRTRVIRDNPEGKSLLRNAYRPWYFKKHIEEIEGIGIERDLAGFPIMTAPEDLDIWNDEIPEMVKIRGIAENIVRNVRRDSEEGLLLPSGWDFKLLSSGSSRQFDTNAIINRYDNRIAITMLSDLILMGSDKTGSFAMAEAKQSLLVTSLTAQTQNIADVFNKYAVPTLLRLNSMNLEKYPAITPGKIEEPSIKEIALLLRSMNLDISNDMPLMNYLRKISNMPQLDKDTFEEVYSFNQSNDNREQIENVDDTIDNDFEQNDLDYM